MKNKSITYIKSFIYYYFFVFELIWKKELNIIQYYGEPMTYINNVLCEINYDELHKTHINYLFYKINHKHKPEKLKDTTINKFQHILNNFCNFEIQLCVSDKNEKLYVIDNMTYTEKKIVMNEDKKIYFI